MDFTVVGKERKDVIETLEEAIVYVLTLENSAISIVNLWNKLLDEVSGLDSRENHIIYKELYNTICYTINKRRSGVKRLYNGNMLYLIFSTEEKIESEYDMNGPEDSANQDIYVTSKDEQCELFIKAINDGYLSPNDIIRDGKTVLMLLVESNQISTVKEILKKEKIDISIEDSKGKTVIDSTTNIEMIKLLIEYRYENEIKNKNIEIQRAEQQIKLLEHNENASSMKIADLDGKLMKSYVELKRYERQGFRKNMKYIICSYIIGLITPGFIYPMIIGMIN